LPVCCDGGLAEGVSQCGVVCALKIREETSFFLEKEASLYLTEAVEWMWILTDWFESTDLRNCLG